MHFQKYFNITAPILLALFQLALPARGQAPSAVSGSAIAFAVADGSSPFANYGYYFLIPADSGNTYQLANIVGITNSSGTYNYFTDGTNSTINLVDSLAGSESIGLEFSDVNIGTYTNEADGGEQDGNYILFAGQAPSSVKGKSFAFSINDGTSPFAASGSATITFAVSDNKYTITGDGVNVPNSTGTYAYFKINSAAGKIVMSDSVAGISLMVLAFIDSQSGSFGTRQTQAANYQVGDFQIVDTIHPTVSVNYPTPGTLTSNEVTTVTGKATDNLAVADVLYSLNGEDWVEASSTNNWTNWFAQIVSDPGTNVLSVYSVDGSGNCSSTNTCTYIYIVSAPLTIQVTGNGTASPNYNNVMLRVGATYKMTAKGSNGFSFVNWTDGGGNIITNSPTLAFTMNYGSTYAATFADTQKPSLSVQYPSSQNVRFSNNIVNVVGRAADNVLVAGLYYSVNNSAWMAANTTNGWTNWNANIGLNPGSNTFQAYSVDSSGNLSKTNIVNIFYVLSAPLSIQATGQGNVRPNLNNSWLPIGTSYVLTALPQAGYAFANWTDGDGNIITNKPVLNFLMTSNLAYTANFVDVTRPKLNFSPKVSTLMVESGIITLNGMASDNAAVTNVLFNMNGNGWNSPDHNSSWSHWSTTIALNPGTNWFIAYAIDSSGNCSFTNSLTIIYATAPKYLDFKKVDFTPDSGPNYSLSCAGGRFGLASANTNIISAVGNYNYARISATVGRLTYIFVAPLSLTNSGIQSKEFNFTSQQTASYSSASGAESGVAAFSTISNFTLPSISYHSTYEITSSGLGRSVYYNANRFLATDLVTSNSYPGGLFSYMNYGPSAALIKRVETNATSYAIASYAGTNYGSIYAEKYDKFGNILNTERGFFGIASAQSGGNAPTTLANSTMTFASVGSYFETIFSAATFSQQSSDPDVSNGAGNYNFSPYVNVGNLFLNYTAPPQLNGGSSSTALNFFAPNLAYFINPDDTVGSAVMGTATNFSMLNTSPAIILATNWINGDVDQLQLANDGTFAVDGDWLGNGTYTQTMFSPQAVMVQLGFNAGNYAGDSAWLQLNYNVSAGGSYVISFYDSGNNLLATESGFFGQQ